MALMFYLIYKITNIINNKIYVGSHKTKNKDDNYMGSGKYLNRAINKHGIENFTKEILFVFDNAKEMYDKEAEIVDDNFLAEKNTYNLKRGGFGGFDYINGTGLQYRRAFTPEDVKKSVAINSLKTPEEWSIIQKARTAKYTKDQLRLWNKNARQRALHDDVKAKRKESLAKINHQQGSSNSQFGTCWITRAGINKKIQLASLNEYIADNWVRGRSKFR